MRLFASRRRSCDRRSARSQKARSGFRERACVIKRIWSAFDPRFAERALARFPLERNRSSDKESRQIKTLERILIAKAYQLLRNSL